VSVESIAIALHHSEAKGTAKLVLIGIANHDGDGGAWPSVATLARYSGVDARNVQRALDRLVKLGEIHRDVQGGGDERIADHRRPNRYRFLLACPHTCDRTRNHRTRNREVEAPLEGVAPASPGGASVTRGGGASVTQTSLQNQTHRPNKKTTSTKRASEGIASCGHHWLKGFEGRYCDFGCAPQKVNA
jgi:hypothetical protein